MPLRKCTPQQQISRKRCDIKTFDKKVVSGHSLRRAPGSSPPHPTSNLSQPSAIKTDTKAQKYIFKKSCMAPSFRKSFRIFYVRDQSILRASSHLMKGQSQIKTIYFHCILDAKVLFQMQRVFPLNRKIFRYLSSSESSTPSVLRLAEIIPN